MPDRSDLPLAIIGGTGPEGLGLALRFAAAGYPVVIGSRDAARARDTAATVQARVEGSHVVGEENTAAAMAGGAVILTVPYAGQAALLPSLAGAIGRKLVINTIAPIAFEGGRPRPLAVPDGSAAQEAQRLLPDASIVAGFHHLSAKHLADLEHPLEGDVLVCGDSAEAQEEAMHLVSRLVALRPVDAGGLIHAGVLEGLTAVLIGVNRRYRTQAGLRLTGL